MKRYIPILILTGIIAISAPFMRPAHSQPLAERLSRINSERAKSSPAQVVIIDTQQKSTSEPLTYYGYVVVNSSSSAGAPTYPNYPHQSVDAAQAMADLYNSGFELVATDGPRYTFAKKAVRE